MKSTLKRQIGSAALLLGGMFASHVTVASPLTMEGVTVNPMIGAGVDNSFVSGGGIEGGAPFVPSGVFTGVVSIFIDEDNQTPGGGICTGSVISSRHIITAAHCVETAGGAALELGPTSDILVVFNDGGSAISIDSAVDVVNHPDYQGFAVCGPGDATGFFGACLNDDLSIITLGEDIPVGVEIFDFYEGDLVGGEIFTMVGHGTTGNGIDGYTASSSDFFNKRFGFNTIDVFDCDDADIGGGFLSPLSCDANGSTTEVWYADFDGTNSSGEVVDTLCDIVGLCEPGLGEDPTDGLFEAVIGGGDSGGPSFVYDAIQDKFLLAGNNTFGTEGVGESIGGFGEVFGGNLYKPYLDWINSVIGPNAVVSAPLSLGLILGGFVLMARRRKA